MEFLFMVSLAPVSNLAESRVASDWIFHQSTFQAFKKFFILPLLKNYTTSNNNDFLSTVRDKY